MALFARQVWDTVADTDLCLRLFDGTESDTRLQYLQIRLKLEKKQWRWRVPMLVLNWLAENRKFRFMILNNGIGVTTWFPQIDVAAPFLNYIYFLKYIIQCLGCVLLEVAFLTSRLSIYPLVHPCTNPAPQPVHRAPSLAKLRINLRPDLSQDKYCPNVR